MAVIPIHAELLMTDYPLTKLHVCSTCHRDDNSDK